MGTIKMTLRVGDRKNGNKAELSGYLKRAGGDTLSIGEMVMLRLYLVYVKEI